MWEMIHGGEGRGRLARRSSVYKGACCEGAIACSGKVAIVGCGYTIQQMAGETEKGTTYMSTL
jgi:hypothetical protein